MGKLITIVGSMSMDFVIESEAVPKQGETTMGQNFSLHCGGKGANQAIAASRLGAETAIIGAVGEDVFGKEVLDNLIQNKIDVTGILRQKDEPTGSAHILLNEGDNRIVVIPAANNLVTSAVIEKHNDILLNSAIVILQNEIPKETVDAIIRFCYDHSIATIYNPAPAREVSDEVIKKATYLTPNETEFSMLFPNQKQDDVLAKYPNKLLITVGEKGVIYHDGTAVKNIPAFLIKPVDTTGAGDTFNGAFAVAIKNAFPIEEAIAFGNLASHLAIQKIGAQTGIPTMDEMKGNEYYEKAWLIK